MNSLTAKKLNLQHIIMQRNRHKTNFMRTVMLLLACVLNFATAWAESASAYAVLSGEGNNKTLTFKYEEGHSLGIDEFDVFNTNTNNPGWHNQSNFITEVVFDESFANARPKSCYCWFLGCTNLTTITGLEYLNTSEVIDMTAMFSDCNGLTSLDLSWFNTSEVVSMRDMFSGCSSLTSLDLSNFSTFFVKYMTNMFSGCSSLTSLTIGCDFFVDNTTSTNQMFKDCTALANGMLIVSGTTAPTIRQNIFDGVFTNNGVLATKLTKGDLGITQTNSPYYWKGGQFKSVGTVKIPYIDENGKLHDDDGTKTPDDTSDDCADALPITSAYGDGGWYFVEGNVNIHRQLMFTSDTHLILCDGTNLTVKSPSDYGIYTGYSLNIYAQSTGNQAGILSATCTLIDQNKNTAIYVYNGSLTINGGQVIAKSWSQGIGCYHSGNLIINGGKVSASGVNWGIYAYSTNIAINGGQVTATSEQQYGIEANNGDITLGWRNADDFIKASSYKVGSGKTVKTAAGKAFNIEGGGTLSGGTTLTSEQLTAIAGKKLTPGPIAYAVLSGEGNNKTLTFKYEPHVLGTNEWDVSDTGTTLPGWSNKKKSITKVVFESTFANARPKSCRQWFEYCTNLTSFTGLEYLNTSNVKDMHLMFSGCKKLTSLDLSSFNTSNVTDISSMFYGCSSLTSLDLSSYNTSKMKYMTSMFYGCSSLTSLDLSSFNTCKVTEMYVMFYGCSSLKSLTIGSGFIVNEYSNENVDGKTRTDDMFKGCTALAEGMLIVTGGVPSIAQNIFDGVFTNGVLATPLTKDQLGITETSSPYTWKGGKFRSVGKVKIPYLDENGKLHDDDGTKTPEDPSDDCAEALPITSSSSIYPVEYAGGWYFVLGDVTIHGSLVFNKDAYEVAHLILCDGALLTVMEEVVNNSSHLFTIYSQSTGNDKGKLTTNRIHSEQDLTINGGQITATANRDNSNGIYAERYLTINGGQVTATATGTNSNGIKVQNNLTINGGQVTANGSRCGIDASGITINCGQLTATSSNNSAFDAGGIFSNNITLGWTNADDFIQASSYYVSSNKAVKTADGKILQYGDNGTKLYEGNITTLATSGTLNNVKLTPYGLGGYCGENSGKNLKWEIPLVDHDNNAATPKQLSTLLTIEGSGTMADYSSTNAPWKDCSVSLILVADETAYNAFAPKVSDTDKAKLTPQEITLKKNDSGWGTYCHNYPVSYSIADDNSSNDAPKAYTVSGLTNNGNSVAIAEVTNNYIAPATPLLLNYSGTGNVTLTALLTTATTPSSSAIVNNNGTDVIYYGNANATDLSSNEITDYIYTIGNTNGKQSYVLRNGYFVKADKNEGIAAHRCWLNVSTTTYAARELTIGEERPTPVPSLYGGERNDSWYTIDGRKLSGEPTNKGIYINKGMKVIIQ